MKRSLKLAEVCKQLDLPPYVLRYWETEFPALQKGSTGRSGASRTYDEAEIGVLRRIKQLLYDEGYTIAGARKKLDSEPPPPAGETGGLFVEEEKKVASKPRRGARRKKKAPAEPLDSTPDERIETLRRGVAEALREAREILSLLERPSD